MLESLYRIFKNYEAKPLDVKNYYAVLLPLIEIDEDLYILYESRSHKISQPGDTSFPGGRVEEGESFQQAALRETVEELGIAANKIEILGEMDYIVSGDRVIACFVGILHITSISELNLSVDEVDHVFTVPLLSLLRQNPEHHRVDMQVKMGENFPYDRIPNGQDYKFTDIKPQTISFYDVGDEILWGMTAKLTERFIEIARSRDSERFV